MFLVQHILMRDWSDMDNIYYIIHGFDQMDEDSTEILFAGASQVENGVSPMRIYEDTGIVTYNVATSGQTLPGSYYMLKNAFRTQSPSVVVIDPASMFSGGPGREGDKSWRYILDNLPFGELKIEMAKEYGEIINEGDFLSGLIPLIKYHTRWTELTKNDFEFHKPQFYYTGGLFMAAGVRPTTVTLDGVNREAAVLSSMVTGTKRYIENGVAGETSIDTPLFAPSISEYALKNMQRIIDLCNEQGARLVFVKIPKILLASQYPTNSWTRIHSDMIRSYAAEHGIPFYDMVYDGEPVVDFTTDTLDAGMHLNLRGVEKVTRALETWLLNNFTFTRERNEKYDIAIEKYHKVREVVYLQSETEFDEYLNRLLSLCDKSTILIAARDDYTTSLTEEELSLLGQLGLQMPAQGRFGNSYIAVIENGNVSYEALSDRRINHSSELNGGALNMSSSGWYTIPLASIKIDGTECAINGRGLNFVVIDDETDLIIDSVSFDTWQVSKPYIRNWTNIFNYLHTYESEVCFE